jgi:hypothetical protein
MTNPGFPLICISKDNSMFIIQDEKSLSKVSTSALVDKTFFKDNYSYDSNGIKWTYELVSDKFKDNFMTRLLAKTFYNPLLDARIIWTQINSYELQELKNKLKLCLDKDDDILTQFETSDIINLAISKANTYDKIMAVLNKYIFEVNEEELYKEQDEIN